MRQQLSDIDYAVRTCTEMTLGFVNKPNRLVVAGPFGCDDRHLFALTRNDTINRLMGLDVGGAKAWFQLRDGPEQQTDREVTLLGTGLFFGLRSMAEKHMVLQQVLVSVSNPDDYQAMDLSSLIAFKIQVESVQSYAPRHERQSSTVTPPIAHPVA